MSTTPKLCVLCEQVAIATAAHIPVCAEHFEAYQAEGLATNPYTSDRPFFNRLKEAQFKRGVEQYRKGKDQ